METFVAIVTGLTRLAFVLVAVAAVRRWRSERSRSSGALAAALTLLALAMMLGRVAELTGVDGWGLDLAVAAAFAGSGFAVLEHRSTVLPLGRPLRIVAAAALAAPVAVYAALGVVTPPTAPPTGQQLAAYALLAVYLVIVGEPAVRLWRRAGQVPIVRRTRLRLLSTAYASIALVLLAVTAASGARQAGSGPTLAANLVGLALVPVLYLAVAPPARVRHLWLQRHTRREAAASLPVATWYLDLEGQELWWSSQLRDLIGLPADVPATLATFFEHVHPDDREWLRNRVEGNLLDPRRDGADFRLVRVDGAIRHVNGRAEVLTEPSGEVSAVFGMLQDVTERKRAQRATEAALARQREATERLQQLDRMKNSFLAAVSHELRTPLTVVAGLARTLDARGGQFDEEQRRAITGRLIANTDRLGVLLDDLLDLNRLLRGDLRLDTEQTDLVAVTRRIVASTPTSTHQIEIEAPEAIDARVDPVRFERILDNLVRNALVHTPSGSRIRVGLTRDDDGGVHVTVTDDGPGIPDDLKSRLFKAFERGPGTHATGTGLGLSIVAEFTRAHGGSAWITDGPGGGTSVHVRLPAASASAPAPGPGHGEFDRAPMMP